MFMWKNVRETERSEGQQKQEMNAPPDMTWVERALRHTSPGSGMLSYGCKVSGHV